jgi:translation initiation factor IF-2
VTARLESMLPSKFEISVTGEAEIVELFDIKEKRSRFKKVGGAKVFNGAISLKQKCRITREGKIIFSGICSFWQRLTF